MHVSMTALRSARSVRQELADSSAQTPTNFRGCTCSHKSASPLFNRVGGCMYCCFLREDTDGLINDPLIIQKEYAKRIGSLYVGSLERQKIFDDSGAPVTIANEVVLLRCTYDNLIAGLRLLEKQGANLIETEADIKAIESWHELGLTKRQLWEVDLLDLVTESSKILGITDKIFVKSKSKGFSAVINTSRIAQLDSEIIAFLEAQSRKYGNRMVFSKYIPIKTDSFGTRETRHVILDNQVANSSRFLHSIKHTAPKSHMTKAQEIVHRIKDLGVFPSNYVLDLGEFVDDNDNPYVDIVELNPLSCSMCFVNNSIFSVDVPEIREYRKLLMMGYEFCFDALRNPQRYTITRATNRSYAYTSDSRYFFL